jgi:alkylmercury lyase
MSEGCRDDLPVGPEVPASPGALAVSGFAALWRGERPHITQLTGDTETVNALMRAGRLELDDHGFLMGVHGLAARPTRHRIEHGAGGRAVPTWCAFDAIGIPAALSLDATAVTTCPYCGAQLRVKLSDGVPDDDGNLRLWLPNGPGAHLVEDFCSHANLYCSADHLRSMVPSGRPGDTVTVTEAAAIGRRGWAEVAAVVGDADGDQS